MRTTLRRYQAKALFPILLLVFVTLNAQASYRTAGFPEGRRTAGSVAIHRTSTPDAVHADGWAIDTWLSKSWYQNAWLKDENGTDYYDVAGNHTGTLLKVWDTTSYSWIFNNSENWFYDEDGRETLYVRMSLNSGSYWGYRSLLNYDSTGYLTHTVSQDSSGGGWIDAGLDVYDHDAQGNYTSDLQQVRNGQAWVNSMLYSATYDTNGNQMTFLAQEWYNNAWLNEYVLVYTYDDDGNMTSTLKKIWNTGVWVTAGVETVTYDANGRLVTDLKQTWNGSGWVNYTKAGYTYDATGNYTEVLEQNWGGSKGWVNSKITNYTWKRVSGLGITAPDKGETVLAGTTYEIRWIANGPDSVRLEFSADSGTTFKKIADVAADQWRYAWHVPETLSAKCRIKISDIADTSENSKSDQFRVKPYILTRFRPNGDYEAFDPAIHGWRFANAASNMWPQSWFMQFDYTGGFDPFTARHYPQNVFRAAPMWAWFPDFPDWPLFVNSFGISACYDNVAASVYSPRALEYWRGIKGNWGGSCFGFAVSGLLDFDFAPAFRAYFPQLGSFGNVHDLPINNDTRSVINQLFQYQYGLANDVVRNQQWHVTPRQTLGDLKTAFMSGISNARPLYMINLVGQVGAHEVVPYKLERLSGTIDVHYSVYLYDNNCPDGDCGNGVQSILDIDSTADTWNYRDMYGTGSGVFLEAYVNTFLSSPVFNPGRNLSGGVRKDVQPVQASGSYIHLMNSSAASIAVSNRAGETIGFHDSTVVNTFSSGYPVIPATDSIYHPIGYYIPDDAYSIRMGAYPDSLTVLALFGDATVFSYWRTDALHAQADNFTYDHGIAYGNPDNLTKKVNFGAILSLGNSERQFQLLNCPSSQMDSLQITTPDSNMLTFVNRGPQKLYDLSVVQTGTGSSGEFTHTGITVPANSTHYILPAWPDLHQPLKILEDLGNTGTISDTLTITDESTGVLNRPLTGIPAEFALLQNYPNPFNPSTTIGYTLPKASHVTLKVYTVLGQVVAALVDEFQQAGYRSVTFNGENLRSGVYFYTIHAGNYVETRKLLLLK
jgi:hypothetical protein